MNPNKNHEARRAAMDAYLGYCHAIYRINAAEYAAAREIIAERRELHPDDDAVINLDAELSVWATENASIRSGLMTAFAEKALRAAQDRVSEHIPAEIAAVCGMTDDELRDKIAEETEKIKFVKRTRGLQE